MANAHDRDGVIANIAVLVGKARAEGAPVIWVQHSGDTCRTAATAGSTSPSSSGRRPSR